MYMIRSLQHYYREKYGSYRWNICIWISEHYRTENIKIKFFFAIHNLYRNNLYRDWKEKVKTISNIFQLFCQI